MVRRSAHNRVIRGFKSPPRDMNKHLVNLPLSFLVRTSFRFIILFHRPFFKLIIRAGYPVLEEAYCMKSFELIIPKGRCWIGNGYELRIDFGCMNLHKRLVFPTFLLRIGKRWDRW